MGELAAPVYMRSVLTTGISKMISRWGIQASLAFFRSRFTPMRGKPRMADWTMVANAEDKAEPYSKIMRGV